MAVAAVLSLIACCKFLPHGSAMQHVAQQVGLWVMKPVVWVMAAVLPDKGFTIGHCSGLYSTEAFYVYLVIEAALAGYAIGWLFTKIWTSKASRKDENS